MIKLLSEDYNISLLWSDIDNVPQNEIVGKLGLKFLGRKMLHEMFLECYEIVYDKNGSFVYCNFSNTCTHLFKIENKSIGSQDKIKLTF